MPSIVPGFEYDIFISYRQKDNKYDGWVNEFVSNLRKELEAALKEEVSVYFDENPHDGLLETHDVDGSLKEKLRCLIFIPIVSRTYCDPKSFAWEHEFKAFLNQASGDSFGLKIKLNSGNVASRILPIRIHDLDKEDTNELETELKGPLRPIDFLFKTPGVNRPLRPDDSRTENDTKLVYRDQINKVGNSIRELIHSLKKPIGHTGDVPGGKDLAADPIETKKRKRWIVAGLVALLLSFVIIFLVYRPKSGQMSNFESIDKSIAVLPFKNLSGDPRQEYFSDGITEEIINSIAQIKGLKVPGRSSSFWFKGKDLDLREIGEKLKVSAVLEGSVRKQGERVKIDAQITSVKDGYQVWSQQFDRKLTDVFAIEEEIAHAIAERLKITLLQREKIELGEDQTQNTAAYDAVLRARYFWNNRQPKEAEKYFKEAIKFDPGYAAAYAGLAETYVIFPFFHTASPDEAMPKAEEAAKKAIQLDSLLSGPYATLGFKNYLYDLNPIQAKKYFAKALRINPNSPQAHYWYGQFLNTYESPDLGIVEMRHAIELEPYGSPAYFNLGISLTCAGKFNEAVAALKTSTELNKQNLYAYSYLGNAYMGLGQFDEAQKAYEQATELTSDPGAAILIYLYIKYNQMAKANKVFEGMLKRSQTEYVSRVCIAIGAYHRGQKELAFDYLAKAAETHDIFLAVFLNNPTLLPVAQEFSTDPRTRTIWDKHVNKMNQMAEK